MRQLEKDNFKFVFEFNAVPYIQNLCNDTNIIQGSQLGFWKLEYKYCLQ